MSDRDQWLIAILVYVVALMVAILLFSTGCTIEVRPLKHKRTGTSHVHRKPKPTPTPDLSRIAPLIKPK